MARCRQSCCLKKPRKTIFGFNHQKLSIYVQYSSQISTLIPKHHSSKWETSAFSHWKGRCASQGYLLGHIHIWNVEDQASSVFKGLWTQLLYNVLRWKQSVLSKWVWAANLVPRQVLEIPLTRGKPWQVAKDRFPVDMLTAVVSGSLEGQEWGIMWLRCPASGIDGFPAVTVYAVDAAHVVWHRGHIIQVGSGVNLSAGVEPRIHSFLLGNSIRVG